MIEQPELEEVRELIRWHYNLIEDSECDDQVKVKAHDNVRVLLVEPIVAKIGDLWNDTPYDVLGHVFQSTPSEKALYISTFRLGKWVLMDELACIEGMDDPLLNLPTMGELVMSYVTAIADIASVELSDYKAIRSHFLKAVMNY